MFTGLDHEMIRSISRPDLFRSGYVPADNSIHQAPLGPPLSIDAAYLTGSCVSFLQIQSLMMR